MNSIRNRIELAMYFNQLGFDKGAEIGVADGRYSEILCQKISGLELFSIDPWTPYEGNWRNTEYQKNAYLKAEDRLRKYNVHLLAQTSLTAATDFQDESLDFVFIDGDHRFDPVMLDILLWAPKVRKGGIVAGHDYYEHKAGGVIPAVDAYVKAHNIQLNIIPRDEGAHQDDKVPCWWFVK